MISVKVEILADDLKKDDPEVEVLSPEEQEDNSQFDNFTVDIIKTKSPNFGSIRFECTSRDDVIVIEKVIWVESDPTKTKSIVFSDLDDYLQTNFEQYLERSGINSDFTEIIKESLAVYDSNYDKEWASKIIDFLSLP